MLATFRWIIGHALMLPFSFSYFVLSKLLGKQKALAIVGKMVTKVSVVSLNSIIPKMHDNNFLDFKGKIIKNFSSYRLLYDVEVQSESDESVQFKILNCPFTSALKNLGTPELCRFACAGDFVIAKMNKNNWKFTSTHSLGTDGICCNHAYYSLDCKNNEAVEKNRNTREEKSGF